MSNRRTKAYKIFSVTVITILAILFAFTLYWIITGSFKTAKAINAPSPQWWPQTFVLDNYQKLFSRQLAPVWEFNIPFLGLKLTGPNAPAAISWLVKARQEAAIAARIRAGFMMDLLANLIVDYQMGRL